MARVISFFNNKGGVGKTTTSTNIAAGLAQKFNKKVLYIDLDPQCNSTLLITGEDVVTECYWSNPGSIKTILNVVEPLLEDDPSIYFDASIINKNKNRFGVDVLMGHPKLSAIEDRLGEAWVKVAGGEIGPLRKTNWCNALLQEVRTEYDYILIDLGPSLGSLNRSALIASDYFVTPMSIDIFSIIGLRNISDWLTDWIRRYERGIENLLHSGKELSLDKYPVRRDLPIKQGCIGYTTQSYATRKNVDGQRRTTQAFENILSRFSDEFMLNLGDFIHPSLKTGLVLGEIPNMFSLAPLAQKNSVPIRGLKASDGIFGAHYSQAAMYSGIFDRVSENVIANTGGGND
nr:AAA family ATPase [uncultured Janthinobacterium sp.]